MERAAQEYEDSIPAGATEVPAGQNGIGRAVSADEALDTRSRKKSSDKDDVDKKDERTGTSDRTRTRTSERDAADERSSRPGHPSGTAPPSDTDRHAGTRQSTDEPSARTGRSDSDAVPTRGAADLGKEE